MTHGIRPILTLLLLHTVRVLSEPSVPYSNATEDQQPSVLTSLTIQGGAATISRQTDALNLTHVVAGTRPTEFRVSARADMANALWMPYTVPLHVRGWQSLLDRNATACDGAKSGRRLQLFLQVRTELGSSVRIVNGQRVLLPQKVESNIISDIICVVPDP